MLLLAALLVAADGTAALMPRGWSVLCPRGQPDEMTVCAERDPPRSQYRAPLELPRDYGERGTASVSAERNSLLGPDTGTIGTCSTWGPGGMFGCSFQAFKNNVNQAAGQSDPRGRVYAKPPR